MTVETVNAPSQTDRSRSQRRVLNQLLHVAAANSMLLLIAVSALLGLSYVLPIIHESNGPHSLRLRIEHGVFTFTSTRSFQMTNAELSATLQKGLQTPVVSQHELLPTLAVHWIKTSISRSVYVSSLRIFRFDGLNAVGSGTRLIVWRYRFPLWIVLPLLAVLPMAWLMHRRRERRRLVRLQAGLCPACGYDLRESAAACPECGLSRHAAHSSVENPLTSS